MFIVSKYTNLQVNIYNYYYHDTRTGYGYENKMSKTSVILYIEVRKNTSLVLILSLHLFIDKHLRMFCSAWKTCVTYSVSHNSIHHPEFSGNQGNHHNFVTIFCCDWFELAMKSKLYIPSTLNIALLQWHTHLNVCAVK